MNDANNCKEGEVKVRLCFFVKVRNANGLKVAGGSIIGRTLGALAGTEISNLLTGFTIGCTGVPNAGDDDGIGFTGAGVFGGWNRGAVRACTSWFWRLILNAQFCSLFPESWLIS